MPSKKNKRSGNPKARAAGSGRVTPKGGHPKPQRGLAPEAPGASQRALAAAGHARRAARVHPTEWKSEQRKTTVLRGVLDALENRPEPFG